MIKIPTQERLHELFDYDELSGNLIRLVSRGRAKAGINGGTVHWSGYMQINVDGVKYQLSRIIWLHKTGQWPIAEIDHKNGVKNDNRWCNLREASKVENGRNRPKKPCKNSHLPKNVRKNGKGYQAFFYHNQKFVSLGTYKTSEEAGKIAKEHISQVYGEFYREG